MKRNDVKNIVLYYKAIPDMVKLLKQESAELEGAYDGLRGTSYDGMAPGSAPGKPVEALAVRLAETGIYDRLQEISVRVAVLEADAATIRACMDDMNGKYKGIITMRLLHGYSWGKISARLGVPDSTARYWFGWALERLADILDEVPMAEELERRASRARSL